MGYANVAADYKDDLLYVPYDYLSIYTKNNQKIIKHGNEIASEEIEDYEYNKKLSQLEFDEFKERFCTDMQKKFKSLQPVDRWKGRYQHIILENSLFEIALQDNQWSIAVELLNRDDYPYSKNFQTSKFPAFFKGMRDILFTYFDKLYIRTGAYTSKAITKESIAQSELEEQQALAKSAAIQQEESKS